jgi:amino acid transporter
VSRNDPVRGAVFVLRPTLTVNRVWRPRDGLIFNWFALNAPAMIVLQFMIALPESSGGSLVAAVLVAGVCCLALTVVYAYLGSSHPRNGGDYLFQRRLFSPRVGVIFGFTAVVVGGAMSAAFAGWMAVQLVITPALVMLGRSFHQVGLIQAAWKLQSTTATLVAAAILLGAALALNLLGMRRYARLQAVMFWAAAAFLVCAVVALALAPLRPDSGAFASAARTAAGLTHSADGLSPMAATRMLMPFMATVLLPVSWSVIQGGEINGSRRLRNQVAMLLPAEAAVIALTATLVAILSGRFGRQDLAAGAALFVRAPGDLPLPCPPIYWVRPGWSMLGPGALLAGTAVGLGMWVSSLALAGSRLVQVVSADRLLPRWLAVGVTPRGVPKRGLLAFLAAAAAFAVGFWLADDWLLARDAALTILFSALVTTAAGALYPFLRREDYRESTAAPSEILGVPIITIAGVLFVCFGGFAAWSAIFGSGSPAGGRPITGRIVLVGVYAGTLGVFTFYRWMRRLRPERQVELLCEPVAAREGRE